MSHIFGKSVKQSLPDKVGDNATRLAILITNANWAKVAKIWFIIHLALLFSVFTLIAVIRIANKI